MAAACAEDRPRSLASCEEIDCLVELASELRLEGEQRLLDELAGMDDPLQKQALVLALTEAEPGTTGRLCRSLEPGPSRERCQALNQRAHLVEGTKHERGDAAKGGRPVASSSWLRARWTDCPDLPWTDLPPAPDCPDASQAVTCLTTVALEAAAAGEHPRAAAACQAIDDPKWSADCYFQAAERSMRTLGLPGARDSVLLCRGSKQHLENCYRHVLDELAAHAPGAGASAYEWAELEAAIHALADASSWDERLSDRASKRAWSAALLVAYQRSSAVTGAPLDHLPGELHPLVRAAAAWRLWELEGHQPRDLGAWERRLADLLGTRPAVTHSAASVPQRRGPFPFRPAVGTTSLSYGPYLVRDQRFVAEDEQADRLVCALEAAARWPEPLLELMVEALGHGDPAVRATAGRLLRFLDAEQSHLELLLEHEDPVVRAIAQEAAYEPVKRPQHPGSGRSPSPRGASTPSTGVGR